MTALKGYFDDSGKEHNPALSIAGYVGIQKIWDTFEIQWKRVLDRHDIPYFHMKEISSPKSPMYKFYGLNNQEKSKALFQDLTGALSNCWSLQEFAAFGCVVPKEPLERFNRERGRGLQAIPLAIFTCDIHMQHYFRRAISIEAYLDRLDKPESKIALAKEYLRTSPRMKDRVDISIIAPIKGDNSVKNLQPLQAADLAAWEVRNKYKLLKPFFDEVDLSHIDSHAAYLYEYDDWLEQGGHSYGSERKSFTALGEATTFRCPIWTYEVLCEEDDLRKGRWRD